MTEVKTKVKRKKKSSPTSDPDEPYHRWLDETYYIARSHRERTLAAHMECIDVAIKAFTTAMLPYEEMLFLSTGSHACDTEVVPMPSVPSIIRSLGFNPTTKQLMQIGWITALVKEPPVELFSDILWRASWEKEQDTRLRKAMSATQVVFQLGDVLAIRKKLENVGLQLLQTGSFVFDPSEVPQVFLPEVDVTKRIHVVVPRSDPDVVDKVFATLWASANTCERGAGGIRQMDIVTLRKTLTEAMGKIKRVPGTIEEPTLTKVEIDNLLISVSGADHCTVDEDTFALSAA